jgi:hypothetical protein
MMPGTDSPENAENNYRKKEENEELDHIHPYQLSAGDWQ